MLRRLIRIILARKRNASDHWRRLYERELKAWQKERRYLISQIAVTRGASPMIEHEQPHVPAEHLLSEEELVAKMERDEASAYARSAAFDDFEYEKLQYLAQSDPIWRAPLAEAERLRMKGRAN